MDTLVKPQAPCQEEIRIRVHEGKVIIIRDPRTNDRTSIRARTIPYGVREENGWLIIPELEGKGLPRKDWLSIWHDIKAEVERYHDGKWTNYFDESESYE